MRKNLPGDKTKKKYLEELIRVNHAGEFAAKRIYEGQLAVLKNDPSYNTIKHMAEQELQHLTFFKEEMIKRKVRPSIFLPIWDVASFLLGAGTALLGSKSAMACTEAVEEVIDDHYKNQLENLDKSEENLINKIDQFRLEEIEHKEIAIENYAHHSHAYPILTNAIKTGCKIAIWLSKKF
jgi:3-demethoxyubiquinol 3-hydroxylase